ncbi:diguanylate cyclase [Egicoccus sp. AB-alg6-2]|uniref:GGDEF domain-containing protein n=1 Tax=Egicoccus sp. AB-alg6-2 TaxID=3242692 RepID=UPI00359D62F4
MSATASDDVARRARLRAITFGRLLAHLLFGLYLVTLGPDLVDPAGQTLLRAAAVVHLSVNALALLTPEHPRALRAAIETTTIVDAAMIAVLVAVTGGVVSPFIWLVLAEAVAVTLVFGWGGGLRAAIMLTLAVLWIHSVTPPVLAETIDVVAERDTSLAMALSADHQVIWLLVGLGAVTALVGCLSAVAERDLRGWLSDLTMLRQVTRDLDPRLGIDRVCDAMATTMVKNFGYRGAVVWLMQDVRLRPVSQAGRAGVDAVAEGAELSPAVTPMADAVERREPTLVRRTDLRPGALQRVHGPNAPLVLLPLRAEGRLLAVISAEVGRSLLAGPALRGADLRRLGLLADEASLLLDNTRLQADLKALATTDGLTGLPNHRFLQQRLGEEVARLDRNAADGDDRPLSVALFDLDFFKKINDTYGHPTGDAVLVAVSRAADGLLRASDVVCRYGGEEFALVLVDTGADEAVQACQRLGEAIRSLRVRAEDGRDLGTITASFGVATTVGPAMDRAELIAGADRALYAAKHAGRNRVVHLDDIEDPAERNARDDDRDDRDDREAHRDSERRIDLPRAGAAGRANERTAPRHEAGAPNSTSVGP